MPLQRRWVKRMAKAHRHYIARLSVWRTAIGGEVNQLGAGANESFRVEKTDGECVIVARGAHRNRDTRWLLARTLYTNLQGFFCGQPVRSVEPCPVSRSKDVHARHALLTCTPALLEYKEAWDFGAERQRCLGIVTLILHNASEKKFSPV